MHISGWNVVLEVINFLILAWLLQRFVFVPIRGVLEKRQQAVDASLKQAEGKTADAEHLLEEYRAKTAAIADDAARARDDALAAARREAEGIHQEMLVKAQAELELARRALQQERADTLHDLEARAADLATSIAERLLHGTRPDSDAPYLWQATASIDSLDPAAKTALAKELVARGIETVSSRPLDAATRERFERWLSTLADGPVRPVYGVDDALIAGVELRVPTGVYRSHLRASLDRVRAELTGHAAAA